MKKYAILSIILFLSQVSLAQLYKESQDVVIQDENGKVLEYGLAGGLNQPQFSNMDVDGDGKKDLVVFDRSGSKLLVFISQTTGGQISYMFDPSYEEFFPEAKGFLVLKDYNDDGKEDVWLFTHDSLELYQNNSTSTLAFDLKAKLIAYDHVNPSSFNPFKKLSPIRGSFPAIYDIDGDKDIDFISNLNVNGSNMIFNKNVSVDSGQALEDIEYEIIDKCYGGLAEENFNVILNAECIFAIEK
ncbi:MAG: FG-GAP repeat domain-containing protein, partial [Bacteroidia bacterium]